MIGEYTETFLLERAKNVVEKRTESWEISTSPEVEDRIPKFRSSEIEIGEVFGKGGFFQVREVKSIRLADEEENEVTKNTLEKVDDQGSSVLNSEYENYIHNVVQDRKFMARHCIRQGKDGRYSRYAIKSMLEGCKQDPSMFVNTVVDIAIEAKFLSVVRHPNIIKMRATSAGDICSSNSFLILDRLYDTLAQRILQWEKTQNSLMHRIFDFQKKKEKAFLAERLSVAYDIASALSYLHERNIMYRDLKPDNIGFDVRGDAKLFDFGLATEFESDKTKKGTYKLTGDTGTIRYMAPEVALSQPYTFTADCYSFGILLWHMLSLEMPYARSSDTTVARMVLHGGHRPKIDGNWPSEVRRLLQDSFGSPPRRPQMSQACEILIKEIKGIGVTNRMLVGVGDDILDSNRSAMSARNFNY